MHALEHTTFIFFGCLVWMPLFGPLPKPQWFGAGWKVAYVFAVRFAGAILGNVLMWSGTILYPIYAARRAYWHISPQTDQSTAGALMMVEGTFLALGVLAWIFLEVARRGSRSSACSTSPTSAASSSTSAAPSARSPPGTARCSRSGSSANERRGRRPGW